MWFALRLQIAVAFIFVVPSGAIAAATYAWVPHQPNGWCQGVLELSDEAFLRGRVGWMMTGMPDTTHPIARFDFDVRLNAADLDRTLAVTGGAESNVEFAVRFGAPSDPSMLCCAWDFDLKVEGAGLSGRLRVTTEHYDIILAGTEKGWEIERAGSDASSSGVICGVGGTSPCVSSGGHWVLISRPEGK